MFPRRSCEGTAVGRTRRIYPPALRYGEQPQPACAQGKRRRPLRSPLGLQGGGGKDSRTPEQDRNMMAKIIKGSDFKGVVDYIFFTCKVCDWWLDKEYSWGAAVRLPLYSQDTIVLVGG